MFTKEMSDGLFIYAEALVKRFNEGKTKDETPYIVTHCGHKYHHTWPALEDICIEDIAHALSQICRFTGHINRFYSVAQHSVLCSYICDPADALEGLLHDASEAYCSDINRPLKRSPGMEIYRYYEKICQNVISQKFNLNGEPASVKRADMDMLITERDSFYSKENTWENKKWNVGEDVNVSTQLKGDIIALSPKEAEQLFLTRFYELTGENKFYEQVYKEVEAGI